MKCDNCENEADVRPNHGENSIKFPIITDEDGVEYFFCGENVITRGLCYNCIIIHLLDIYKEEYEIYELFEDELQDMKEFYYRNYEYFYNLAIDKYNKKYENKQNLENLKIISNKMSNDIVWCVKGFLV